MQLTQNATDDADLCDHMAAGPVTPTVLARFARFSHAHRAAIFHHGLPGFLAATRDWLRMKWRLD
jgi:hypothetical protein